MEEKIKTKIVFEEIKGKTVETFLFSWSNSEILISFKDETFTIIGIERGHYDGGEEITDKEFKLGDFADNDLVEAQVLSAREITEMRESFLAKNRARAESGERATYERLKAKYEE